MLHEIPKPPYGYEDFLRIIATLRGEGGCPWDREQSHMSLRPCLMEEAAEVNAAIRVFEESGDYANLREELGDVLLLVAMHARIAEEEGIFTMGDVVNEVAEKIVRRHPHVFGDAEAETAGQALQNWEEIKKKEKEGRSGEQSPLREIPLELPALTRAVKVLKKIDKLYEPMEDCAASAARIQDAAGRLGGLNPETDREEIAAITGDLLMALSNVSRVCRLSPEQILEDRIEEVVHRNNFSTMWKKCLDKGFKN